MTEFQLHDDGRKAIYTGDVGHGGERRPLFEDIEKPLGIHFPSISAEMLMIATCTHVHRTGRASPFRECEDKTRESRRTPQTERPG